MAGSGTHTVVSSFSHRPENTVKTHGVIKKIEFLLFLRTLACTRIHFFFLICMLWLEQLDKSDLLTPEFPHSPFWGTASGLVCSSSLVHSFFVFGCYLLHLYDCFPFAIWSVLGTQERAVGCGTQSMLWNFNWKKKEPTAACNTQSSRGLQVFISTSKF